MTYNAYFKMTITEEVTDKNPFYGKVVNTHQISEEWEYSKLNLTSDRLPPYGMKSRPLEITFVPQHLTEVLKPETMKIGVAVTRLALDNWVSYDGDVCYAEFHFNMDWKKWYCSLKVSFKKNNGYWEIGEAEIWVWLDEEEFEDFSRVDYIAKIEYPSLLLAHNCAGVVPQI